MNLYPLSNDNLIHWEDWLNRLNLELIVPEPYLCKTLSSEDIISVKQRVLKSHQNIPYNAPRAHLSRRYVNEAWIWAQILQPFIQVERITELCGGASILIDLALSYLDFKKSFEKIDYQSWDHLERYEIKKAYHQSYKDINVITETSTIPKTDMIILNHAIDDLFIGLWNEAHKSNYWTEFCDWENVDACWKLAMEELDLYMPILKEFISNVILRLNSGGYLIIRDYPSAYETHRKDLSRINFTRQLTESIIQDLAKMGMVKHRPELDMSYPPLVQETFFIYSKS